MHADLMIQYAKDAQETNEPWKLWQRKNKNNKMWFDLFYNPSWDEDADYRRKPKIININGFEIQEPLRIRPKKRNTYYIVNLEDTETHPIYWNDDYFDNNYFNKGLVHLTAEDAELHKKALLSFTKKQD
jgi:hypothetical protein